MGNFPILPIGGKLNVSPNDIMDMKNEKINKQQQDIFHYFERKYSS